MLEHYEVDYICFLEAFEDFICSGGGNRSIFYTIQMKIKEVVSFEERERNITESTHHYLEEIGWQWDGEKFLKGLSLTKEQYLQARREIARAWFKNAITMARSPSCHRNKSAYLIKARPEEPDF